MSGSRNANPACAFWVPSIWRSSFTVFSSQDYRCVCDSRIYCNRVKTLIRAIGSSPLAHPEPGQKCPCGAWSFKILIGECTAVHFCRRFLDLNLSILLLLSRRPLYLSRLSLAIRWPSSANAYWVQNQPLVPVNKLLLPLTPYPHWPRA